MYKLKALLLSVTLLFTACADKEPVLDVLGGSSIRLSELQGKLVLINYWAEWCKPCRLEIPSLNAFAAANTEKVAIFAVNFDGITGEKLSRQAEKMGIAFPLLDSDPRDIFGVSSSGVLPETLVIDQRGKFQQLLLGPQTEQQLEILLAKFAEDMHYDS